MGKIALINQQHSKNKQAKKDCYYLINVICIEKVDAVLNHSKWHSIHRDSHVTAIRTFSPYDIV